MPVGEFFPKIPEWAWKGLSEVARDAPEQFPRALSEALAAVRASSPRLAGTTMGQLVKSLYLGTGAPLGVAPLVAAAIEGLGGVTATITAGEVAAGAGAAVAGGTVVAAGAAEVAGGGAAAGAAGTAAGWLGGLSAGALALGALVIGGILIGGVWWYKSRDACACESPPANEEATIASSGGATTSTAIPVVAVATTGATCGPVVKTTKLCPDSPQGAAAQACGPGYCWDGGFNHSLACKQEVMPPNAHRSYTNDVLCNDGYTAVTDVCTNVVSSCTK